MSRYLMLVDDSMTFEDCLDLKVGDVYYESEYGAIIKAVVTTPPVIGEYTYNGKTSRNLSWESEIVGFDQKTMKFDDTVLVQNYGCTEGLMNYGPKMYRIFDIWDRETQKLLKSDEECQL